MKIVLVSINAKYIHTNNAVRLLKANSDFDMEIMEFTIKDNISDIVDKIKQIQPDIIGCSVYIWNVSMFKEVVAQLSTSENKIILGGPEVSYEASYFLNYWPIDYVVKGEGEHVISCHKKWNRSLFHTFSCI